MSDMEPLYALAYFNEDGSFHEYVRKGRSNSIVGYDNASSAKRGLAHSQRTVSAKYYDVRIVRASKIYEVSL